MSKKAEKVYCDRCKKECKPDDCSPGYGTVVLQPVSADKHFCYQCCADLDKEQMEKTGKIVLYLHTSAKVNYVNNWPGTLTFTCKVKKGKHNIAGVQYHVYFEDHLGYHWHGVQYGENTMLCHCQRLKRKSKMLKI